jgi:AcrR family transcriptional regulator
MPSTTRERLIDTTSGLMRRQGLNATGIKQILAGSNATFSSLYHHFPGGKDELAARAIESAGAAYQLLVELVWDSETDLERSLRAVFDGAAQALADTDYEDACPIATVAMEVASTNEELRIATARVFQSWIAAASERLAAAGISAAEVPAIAQAIIALLEGAFVLSRATRSIEPMASARDAAVALIKDRCVHP